MQISKYHIPLHLRNTFVHLIDYGCVYLRYFHHIIIRAVVDMSSKNPRFLTKPTHRCCIRASSSLLVWTRSNPANTWGPADYQKANAFFVVEGKPLQSRCHFYDSNKHSSQPARSFTGLVPHYQHHASCRLSQYGQEIFFSVIRGSGS